VTGQEYLVTFRAELKTPTISKGGLKVSLSHIFIEAATEMAMGAATAKTPHYNQRGLKVTQTAPSSLGHLTGFLSGDDYP
jgi:hypothetical protein